MILTELEKKVLELEGKLAYRSLQLQAFEGKLAGRSLQLEASATNLIKLTLTLEASDHRVADLARQLETFESELTQRILRLEISKGNLIDNTPRLKASDAREEVGVNERDNLLSQLNKALSAKTVLMKELHHGVKNNLAVIASLLEMQATTLTDERAIRAFRDSQQRVMSMALIHETLYGGVDTGILNFREYLEKLVSQVHAAYQAEAGLVHIRIAAEDIDLPMHRAIYCGLIVNELLSNAFKYAQPSGHGGDISIQFGRLKSGLLSLSCQDNGPGIPESFDWATPHSVGLRIIQILTNQLNGELKLDRSHGTKFALVFPHHTKANLGDGRQTAGANFSTALFA